MSGAPTRRAISQALLGAALVCATAVLCFRSGGFFDQPRTTLAIGAWVLVAVTGLLAPASLLPPSRAGRLAVAGLLGLAGWTALSLLWAPLAEPARQDVVRVALYAAVLMLAVVAFRPPGVRALEPALALLALVVVGYGLLGELGVLDLDASLAADGRLEQPLSYWNAMGLMAALGGVLCVRIAIDARRPRRLRRGAAAAVAPLAAGLYLTYSRGALATAAFGLLVLVLLAPEAAPLWRRLGSGWRLAAVAATALAVAAAIVVVVGDRASPPARGATAERFTDVGSTRGDYWRVAADALASEPLLGVGASGFRVEWLRERKVSEGAVDAHSLYVETGAELGLVGLVLLAAFASGTIACAVRLYRRDPALAAGPCAALAALALHAGIDWDWEMPAVTLPMLLLAGAVIASDRPVATGRGEVVAEPGRPAALAPS